MAPFLAQPYPLDHPGRPGRATGLGQGFLEHKMRGYRVRLFFVDELEIEGSGKFVGADGVGLLKMTSPRH